MIGAGVLLTFDNVPSGGKTFDSPTWCDLETAIRSMDAKHRTEVGLFVCEDTYLQVGGGSDCYVCGMRTGGKLHVLCDPNRSTEETRYVIAGQGSDYPINECCPLTVILDVARWFWDHKEPSPKHH